MEYVIGFTSNDCKVIKQWWSSHRPKPLGRYKQRHYVSFRINYTDSGIVKECVCSCGEKFILKRSNI